MNLWLCALAILLVLTSCGKGTPRQRAVSILSENRSAITSSAWELTRLPKSGCATSKLGYRGCVWDLPQGRYVNFLMGDLNLVFAPPGSKVAQELVRLTSGSHVRCAKNPEPDTFDLGDGWFLTEHLRQPLGFETASLRGEVQNASALPLPIHLDLVSLGGGRSERIVVPPSGQFCLDRLLPGNHRIWINYDRPPSGWMPYPKTPLTADFDLREQQIYGSLSFRLPDTQLAVETVEVSVQFPDGTPAIGAVAKVDHWDQVATDRDGIARIQAIKQPEHSVSASKVKVRYFLQLVQLESAEVMTSNRYARVTLLEPER